MAGGLRIVAVRVRTAFGADVDDHIATARRCRIHIMARAGDAAGAIGVVISLAI